MIDSVDPYWLHPAAGGRFVWLNSRVCEAFDPVIATRVHGRCPDAFVARDLSGGL